MAEYNYYQGVSPQGQTNVGSYGGGGSQNYFAPASQPAPMNVEQPQHQTTLQAPQVNAMNTGYLDAGDWFNRQLGGGLNPEYVNAAGGLDGDYKNNPFLSGLQDYQLNRLNQNMGYTHGIGSTWLDNSGRDMNSPWDRSGGVQKGYGYMGDGVLDEYAQIGQKKFRSGEYQSLMDTFNQEANIYNQNRPTSLRNGEAMWMPLQQATSLYDIQNQLNQNRRNPYFTNSFFQGLY